MMEGLKPYPEYKESGSKWLGKIPTRWEAVPLGRPLVQRIEQNRPIKTKDILSLSLRQGVVPYSEKKSGGNKAKDDLTAYTLAYPGDIVVNSMNVVVGSVGLSKYFGAVSPVYYVLYTRSEKDSILFFDALFQDKTFQQSLWGLGNGILFLQSKTTGKFNTIRMRIPMHALRRVVIPQPSPDEQAAIVRFLGHANRKIDGFIRAKRKLIGLLNEQKQAIIHQAVTRGLNTEPPLKSSGSFWFPEIPKSWDVVTMRRVIRAAIDGPHFSPQYQDTGIPFLSARNVRPDKWLLDDAKFISESNYKLFCQRVRPEVGDVLYTKGGTTGVARAVDLEFPFQVWVHIAVLKLDHQLIVPEFLAFCLNSPRCYEQAQLFTRGATNQDLGLGRMKQIELPLPPTLAEQLAIVGWLKGQLETFNTAIARTEREIELMQEYRTSLTADIVTGKMDVREAAAKLPELAEDIPVEPALDEQTEEIENEEAEA